MRRLNEETDGAIAVLVAIMMVMLIGFGALAVDAGALFTERRELQSGADAGAFAVAEDCARRLPSCAAGAAAATARGYADANALDGASTAEDVDLDLAASTVTVSTLTRDASSGANQFSLFFGRVLGLDETAVRAVAAARWGATVATARGFPMGVCDVLWQANRPTPTGPGPLVEVRYKGTGGRPAPNDCLHPDNSFKPGTNPGNFSWLDQTGKECETAFNFAGGSVTASGDTGVSVPSACKARVDGLLSQISAHRSNASHPLPIVILPIYETVTGSGNHAIYTLVTLGAFEISGLKVGGDAKDSVVVGSWSDPDCASNGGNHRCIQGRFVSEVDLGGTIVPGADSDLLSVELIR
jgi:Flp pilus assembly protein TadG